MDAETRLNKRIEIAARIVAGDATRTPIVDIRTYRNTYARDALDIADAIIDTAIGDMIAEIKEGIK